MALQDGQVVLVILTYLLVTRKWHFNAVLTYQLLVTLIKEFQFQFWSDDGTNLKKCPSAAVTMTTTAMASISTETYHLYINMDNQQPKQAKTEEYTSSLLYK